jgi:tripartite-type tricarboxylate transporter receptor subunit TctC
MRDPIAVPTAMSVNIDYEYATWYGFLAPAKTPAAVLQRLNRAIADVGEDLELREKVAVQGIAPRNIGLADFDAYIRREMKRLDPLLRSIGKGIGN